ncbi:hypothetical protein [Methanosphaera cuniculi]|uniref:Uncharacterized protein n=1 Tax=Methanosphaera cuniculi TaxID=1077256 RepID=A0A2A2HC61_9EURY|nr:hypothetical protein [Methanosphaera cuniculi]PAV06844.1 hypothetical protein ASJ82_06905 [Methanosphaera cuniculi]PWL08597.1 hypothetical protein MSCUN_03090 [Methanosphaera cuniculi]
MINWNYEKLESMTEKSSTYNSITIDYKILAENFEEIVVLLHTNGETIPLEFEDLNVACKGNMYDKIELPNIAEECKQKRQQLEEERNHMKLKHFSRDISHEEWFEFIDKEVLEFIKKYPQYEKIIIKD